MFVNNIFIGCYNIIILNKEEKRLKKEEERQKREEARLRK